MRPVDVYWGHFSTKSLEISTNRSKRSESRWSPPTLTRDRRPLHCRISVPPFRPQKGTWASSPRYLPFKPLAYLAMRLSAIGKFAGPVALNPPCTPVTRRIKIGPLQRRHGAMDGTRSQTRHMGGATRGRGKKGGRGGKGEGTEKISEQRSQIDIIGSGQGEDLARCAWVTWRGRTTTRSSYPLAPADEAGVFFRHGR